MTTDHPSADRRRRLPNRRMSVTDCVWWQNSMRLHVTAGIDPATGHVRECFLRGGAKLGSDRDAELDDTAILISRLLQHGDHLVDIAAGLGHRVDGERTSLVGTVVDALLALERECLPAVAAE